MTDTLTLAKQLINQASVTPDDNGCQQILAKRLQTLGFEVEHLRFGDVDNLWARKGSTKPLVVFAGHTDVVPAGNESNWLTPPFTASVKDGKLYGRGSADMKGGIAAFISALEAFLAETPQINGSIGVLITADEEGIAVNGTVKVMEHLAARGEHIDYCIIGEPSSEKTLGDVIKNGRRGSLGATLIIEGKQGHIAYPHLADNPIHSALPALNKLTDYHWDNGNADFPPTQLQLSNINAGAGAVNVIPGSLSVLFNFRYSTANNADNLKRITHQILDEFGLTYQLQWRHSGKAFLTPKGKLTDACCQAIQHVIGITPTLSTAGGTSDGRFIAPYGVEVVELGVINATIHQVNECVDIESLDTLKRVYHHILCALM